MVARLVGCWLGVFAKEVPVGVLANDIEIWWKHPLDDSAQLIRALSEMIHRIDVSGNESILDTHSVYVYRKYISGKNAKVNHCDLEDVFNGCLLVGNISIEIRSWTFYGMIRLSCSCFVFNSIWLFAVQEMFIQNHLQEMLVHLKCVKMNYYWINGRITSGIMFGMHAGYPWNRSDVWN